MIAWMSWRPRSAAAWRNDDVGEMNLHCVTAVELKRAAWVKSTPLSFFLVHAIGKKLPEAFPEFCLRIVRIYPGLIFLPTRSFADVVSLSSRALSRTSFPSFLVGFVDADHLLGSTALIRVI
jgi:hypothetical protein